MLRGRPDTGAGQPQVEHLSAGLSPAIAMAGLVTAHFSQDAKWIRYLRTARSFLPLWVSVEVMVKVARRVRRKALHRPAQIGQFLPNGRLRLVPGLVRLLQNCNGFDLNLCPLRELDAAFENNDPFFDSASVGHVVDTALLA